MHIPDGWVDLPTSAGAALVAGGGIAVAGRRTAALLKERATTLPAVLAAYLLVAQLPVVPLGVGTSAHLVGTGLATALVGPSVAIVCVTTVVVVQALVLADGGVTAMGLNLLINGIVPALVAAAVMAAGRRLTGDDLRRIPSVAGAAAALATLAAAATTASVLAIGGTDVIPPGTVAAVIGAAHLLVAAGEGLLTAGIVGVLARLRPDLVVRSVRRPATAPSELARRWSPGEPDAGEPEAAGGGRMSGRHGGETRPGERVVGLLDGWAPEAKLVGLLGFLLVVAVTPPDRPWVLAVQGAVAVAVAAVAMVEPGAILRRLALDLPLVVLAITYAIAGQGPRLTVAGLSLSSAGLRVGLTLLAKATIGIVAVSAMAATTTVPEVVAGLRRLRAPGWLCDLVGLSARQVAVIGDDLGRLRLAAALRAGGRRRPSSTATARALAASFVRATERVDRMQVAAQARGGTTIGTLVRPAHPLPSATLATWTGAALPAIGALAARLGL